MVMLICDASQRGVDVNVMVMVMVLMLMIVNVLLMLMLMVANEQTSKRANEQTSKRAERCRPVARREGLENVRGTQG